MNIDERENYGQSDVYFQDGMQYKDDDSVSNVLDNSITNDEEQNIYNQQDPEEDYRDTDDIDPDDFEEDNLDDDDDLFENDDEDDLDDDDDLDDEDETIKNKRNLYRDRDL